jgi:hypothetical protein
VKKWVVLARSDMSQVEIIRRTRELFEESGSIPKVHEVDASATRVEMETIEMANKLMEVDWEDLTEEEKALKGFFTRYAENLFAVTIAVEYVFRVHPIHT